MARKHFLINLHTAGVTNPAAEEVKLGEIVVKHNNEKPELVIKKSDGTFASFVDALAVDAKIAVVKGELNGSIQEVSGDVAALSGAVDSKFEDYATSADTENAIAAAKNEAVETASAYTDTKVAAAKSELNTAVQEVAGNVTSLSGAVDSKFEDYATSADTEDAIAAAKNEAVETASAYTDTKVAAAKSELTGSINDVADDVSALSAAVDTKFTKYATSADTEDAIAAAKNEAVETASAYTDTKVAAAKSELNTAIQEVAGNVTALSGAVGDLKTELKEEIGNKVSAAYIYKGSCTYAELTAKTENTVGDVWNVSDDHEVNDVVVPAGTNYAWTESGWDALAGVVDMSLYATTATTQDLLTQIQGVAGDVTSLSGAVDSKFEDYATSADTENAIAAAKNEAVETASAYTDTKVAAAKSELTGSINDVADDVSALSAAVDTKFTKYATSADTEDAIAAAKNEAVETASAYTDTKVAAAKSELTGSINDVADDVSALSAAVDTKFTKYATSADTENAIAAAKGEAIASASAYTDGQVSSARTDLTGAINAVSERVASLEGLSGATESAIQEIAVDGIEGVKVDTDGTKRTINFSNMVIDCGEY